MDIYMSVKIGRTKNLDCKEAPIEIITHVHKRYIKIKVFTNKYGYECQKFIWIKNLNCKEVPINNTSNYKTFSKR